MAPVSLFLTSLWDVCVCACVRVRDCGKSGAVEFTSNVNYILGGAIGFIGRGTLVYFNS